MPYEVRSANAMKKYAMMDDFTSRTKWIDLFLWHFSSDALKLEQLKGVKLCFELQ